MVFWVLCQLCKRLIDEHDHAQLVWDHHHVEGRFADNAPGLVDIFAEVVELFFWVKAGLFSIHVSDNASCKTHVEVDVIFGESLLDHSYLVPTVSLGLKHCTLLRKDVHIQIEPNASILWANVLFLERFF